MGCASAYQCDALVRNWAAIKEVPIPRSLSLRCWNWSPYINDVRKDYPVLLFFAWRDAPGQARPEPTGLRRMRPRIS